MDRASMGTVKKIGERIRQFRERQALTQADVARKAALSTNYYARIERGDATATVNALQKIARALKIRSSDILPF